MFLWLPAQVSASRFNELIIICVTFKTMRRYLNPKVLNKGRICQNYLRRLFFLTLYICLFPSHSQPEISNKTDICKKYYFPLQKLYPYDFNVAINIPHLSSIYPKKTYTDSILVCSKNYWTVWLVDSELSKP